MIKINNCLWCKKDYEYNYFPSQEKLGKGKYCSHNCQRLAKCDKQKFWKYATNDQFIERVGKSYEKKVIRLDGCWSWNGSTKTGYGCIKADGINIGAHRISWMIYNGDIPEGKWVLHKCDNRICSNPEHLFLGDRIDNIYDMINKGRHKSGNSKLKIDDVIRIKKILKEGGSVKKLSQDYKVSYGAISDIKNNISWRNI